MKKKAVFGSATYHVVQKSSRESAFRNDADKRHLLFLIRDAKTNYGFKLFAYVIMENHYHLLLQLYSRSLKKIMHSINNRYCAYFNEKYGRDVQLFENRYSYSIIKDGEHILSMLRFVHLNPVRLGICADASYYKWSSDSHYRSKRDWTVDIWPVLEILCKDPHKAISVYKWYINSTRSECLSVKELSKGAHYDVYPGGTGSAGNITGAGGLQAPGSSTLDTILLNVCRSPDDAGLIRTGSRKRRLGAMKKAFAEKALISGFSMRDVAVHMSISITAVRKILNKNYIY